MKKLITILVPAYNEEEVLSQFHARVSAIIDTINKYAFEILFIDDGSKDSTINIIKELRNKDSRVSYVSLSRNFGKEIAMAAGFDHAKGDAVIVIDADLQDPPELIPKMIDKWEEGYDDIYAQRISRKGESFLKKFTSKAFYRILERLSRVPIQKDTGDFRMLSAKALKSLKQFRESERYTKGLFSLIGHKKYPIEYHRDPRAAGKTKWNYVSLFRLAIEGITSFSTAPLKLSTYLGLFFALLSFIFMGYFIFKTIVFGDPVRGYPSMISIILFIGGIQMMSLGMIGEYLGRTFNETKNRPLYFIDEYDSDYQNKEEKDE